MNVCLYKLYKCVHDRVRRFYTSAGLTYGHVAFSSISSTILCEKHVRRRDTRTQYGTKEETGISPGVERVREIGERERKRDRHHGLHFVSLLLCLQSAHLMKTFSVSFSAIRKGFLEPGGSLRRLFIRRVLLNKNTLVFQISGKESTFFGWWVLLHYASIQQVLGRLLVRRGHCGVLDQLLVRRGHRGGQRHWEGGWEGGEGSTCLKLLDVVAQLGRGLGEKI